MSVYYNEIDRNAAAWLRELIKHGHIAHGVVDERSISDVKPDELVGFTQCHFFAGIGGWSLALRKAGWSDDRPVWTGSCPCQPFSAAGARGGMSDERHLWPHWHHLINQCRPATIFGEQVASKDGLGWLDLVQSDLEATGYAFAAADLCAAGVGAPHIRQRLWFVGLADANGGNTSAEREQRGGQQRQQQEDSGAGGLADASADRPQGRLRGGQDQEREALNRQAGCDGAADRPSTVDSQWRDADWLFCRDGKWRPVEPSSQRMADGLSLCLGSMRRARIDEKEGALNGQNCIGLGRKALRVLRQSNSPEAFWLSIGGRIGFPQATFLLSILCEYSRELGIFSDGEATSCTQDGENFLRAMRQFTSSTSCASQGSIHPEQLTRELGDALSELSQDSAQHRELMKSLASYTAGPLANNASARVGRLRGYGNAIVPQAAQAIIESVM
jgi:DNA (cytosine-5)-methyltransferase 1